MAAAGGTTSISRPGGGAAAAAAVAVLVVSALAARTAYAGGQEGDDEPAGAACARRPVVFAFGDSNTDTGGVAAGLGYYYPLPEGRAFFRRATGRLCDGRLVVECGRGREHLCAGCWSGSSSHSGQRKGREHQRSAAGRFPQTGRSRRVRSWAKVRAWLASFWLLSSGSATHHELALPPSHICDLQFFLSMATSRDRDLHFLPLLVMDGSAQDVAWAALEPLLLYILKTLLSHFPEHSYARVVIDDLTGTPAG